MADAKLNSYQKLQKIREEFYNAGVKKSGINNHAEFRYYELEDIIPVAAPLLKKYNCFFHITFGEDKALGMFINLDATADLIPFGFNMRHIAEPAKYRMNEAQGLGAELTYYRRYLYFLMLDIIEPDTFDNPTKGGYNKAEQTPPPPPSQKKPVSQEERAEIKEELTAPADAATDLQIKALTKAITNLIKADPSKKEWAAELKVKSKNFTTLKKKDAEALIAKISTTLEGK